MDHHCCFSDRCVAYYSFKHFVFFTGGVTLLTVIGISTISFNLGYRISDLNDQGLKSFGEYIMMFVRQAPEGGYDYWTFYDILLI